MASDGSDWDAKYALSRLLQRGTVAEYQNEFEMLISRVTGKFESLLASIYIFALKPTLQRALLWSNPITLGEAFSLARVMEARFTDQGPTITSASLEAKGSLDANEDVKKAHTRVHELEKQVEETDLTSRDMVVAEDLGQKHIHDFNETVMLLMTDMDDDMGKAATDRGGELDDLLDEITLDLSQEFMNRVVESRDVFGESLVSYLKWVYHEKNCEVFSVTSRWESCGSERRKVVEKIAEDGRTSGSDWGITI
ncbi:hypothetical protein Tco_1409861 [Tanacetum coccineum]